MSPREAVPSCEEAADLAAVVALDAADARDRRALERHLAVCPPCAQVVDDMRATAASLGTGVPQVNPPPELRERVMAAARREPASLRRVWAGLPLGPRGRVTAAWGPVAACLIISAGSLFWVAALQRQVGSLESEVLASRDRAARYDRIVQVLGSQQLAIRPLTPVVQTLRTGGMIFLDPESRSGMVSMHDLPQLPPGRAWQLWFVRGNERVSGGMLWADSHGNCYSLVAVPPDLDSFEGIGITEEPSQGSRWPTTPRVIGSQLGVGS